MLQRDFLMRMIERLADAFARILNAGDDLDPPEQLRVLEASVSEVFHTPTSLVHLIPERDLREHAPRMRAHLGRVFSLLAQRHSDPARRRAHATRAVVCLADALDEIELEGPPLTESLHEALRVLTTPDPAPWRALLAQTQAQGDFARAEDALFDALDAGADLTAEGLAMYDALLAMDDEALERGGLSRDEVLESRDELM